MLYRATFYCRFSHCMRACSSQESFDLLVPGAYRRKGVADPEQHARPQHYVTLPTLVALGQTAGA